MSRSARNLLVVAVIGGVIALVICLKIIARSQQSIDAAQSPTTTINNTTAPFFAASTTRPHIPTTGPSVRVAVIGGMTFTGFWNALAERYEREKGVPIELITTGEKNDIAKIFKQGGTDVITMHASDTVINLVADGYATDPQPWMRNDLVVVGPANDPAGIRNLTDAADALKKIADTKSPFVVHSSLGAQEVLLNIMEPNHIVFDAAQTTILFDDQQRSVLQIAGQKHAYTIVGRIPFRTGRLPNNGLEMMVQGDPRLERPFIVAVANPAKFTDVHLPQAQAFALYLRLPETQQWISDYGKGLIDDRPLFFPVENKISTENLPNPVSTPNDRNGSIRISGKVPDPMSWTVPELKEKFASEIKNIQYSSGGKTHRSDCIPVLSLLRAAGVQTGLKMDPTVDPKLKNQSLRLEVVVQGQDGYTAAFSLAELLPEIGNRAVWLGLNIDGANLSARDGPAKLIVPEDAKPGRWVRGVQTIWVEDPHH